MKNAARGLFLVLSIIWLATTGPVPAQTQVVSIGILPFQDESGAQVPPELLLKLGQDFKQKLTLSYQDVLVRPVSGVSETPSPGVEQLTAIGKQQGIRYLLRCGVLVLLSEKSDQGLKCDVGLYAELITSDSGAITSLRANGTGSDANPTIDDARRWDAYDFKSSAFTQSALGQALSTAIDQLTQQVHQAVFPSSQPAPEAAAAEGQAQPPATETTEGQAQPSTTGQAVNPYEADQELQQLIAQADSLVASGVASGKDISSLQQALEGLRTSLNNKVSLMEQGQDTSAVDQEIVQHKTELQNIIAASTQEAATQPPPSEPQPVSGEQKIGITKVNELLGETLNSILKIQEIRTAVQSFGQGQATPPPADTGQAATPVEEPTSDVSGVVADSTGNPVEGATVTDPQSGASATTDSSGSYVIPHVPSGRFANITVVKNGKQLSAGKIQLQPGHMALADWQTGPGGTGLKSSGIKILPSNVIIASKTGGRAAKLGTLKGVVRDDQGKPVVRALVMVKGLGMARTDSQGQYGFINAPQGDYQVMVQKGGSTVQTQRVSVTAKKVVENQTLYKGKAITSPALGKQAVLARGAGATLKGKVSNKDKQPLPGAKVTAVYPGGALSVFADAKGKYEFKDLQQGSYRLLANKAGYQEASRDVALKGKQSEERDFVLEKSSVQIQKVLAAKPFVKPSPITSGTKAAPRVMNERTTIAAKGQLSGVVRDAKGGKPIIDATIQVNAQHAARTDRQGNYRINDLPPGSYRVVAGHKDYQQEDKTVTIRSNSTSKEDFSLKGKERQSLEINKKTTQLRPMVSFGNVRGRITDSKTGKPIAQAIVTLSNQRAQSNASGDYSFQNVPAGSYAVTVERTNYQGGSSRITVQAGKTASADFRLVPKLGIQIQKRH